MYFLFSRLFGNSGACTACGQTIPASEFVMRTGVPQQPGAPPTHYVFHLKCFACSQCGSHLVPGDRYYMLSGKLVCEQDWHKLLKTNTTGGTVRKGKVGRPRRSRDWSSSSVVVPPPSIITPPSSSLPSPSSAPLVILPPLPSLSSYHHQSILGQPDDLGHQHHLQQQHHQLGPIHNMHPFHMMSGGGCCANLNYLQHQQVSYVQIRSY